MAMRHQPVMLEEVERNLAIDPEGLYVDCTLGAAGYAARILSRLEGGRLIALDRDEAAIAAAAESLAEYRGKVEFERRSFAEIAEVAPAGAAAGIVADLGWSLDQVEDPERGFSFRLEGPLDARFDRRQELTAADIINHYDERELADLFFELAGERRSRRIARAIVRGRPFRTTTQLAALVESVVPRARGQKIHPATRVFQALRMAVNDELGQLDRFLEDAPSRLRPGGRLAVVSFHSLEDGRVKRAFRRLHDGGEYLAVTRRPLSPTEAEVEQNPPSRSARLRVLERK